VIDLARKPKPAASRPGGSSNGARTLSGRAGLALVGALSALLLMAVPAGAIVAKVGSAEVGLQPRNTEFFLDGNGELGASFANAGGNPVMHGNATYDVFWDPTNAYHGDWQEVIDTYLQRVGSDSGAISNVFSVDTQYTDRSNVPATYHTVYKGAYTDTDGYPGNGCTDPHPFQTEDQLIINKVHKAVCLTDSQVREELSKFVSQHALPKGMGTIYDILTPPGLTVCLDGGGSGGHCSDFSGSIGSTSYENSFCSYHGAINPGGLPSGDANTVLYATVPWTAGGLGNPHLLPADQRIGYDCQDGGFDPSSKPIEEPERAHEKTKAEKEEFEEMTTEEKEKVEEREALEGPHAQEPNQPEKCPGHDGGCDTGLADLIVNQLAVEQQNVVTDPLLNGWQDVAHNEATDECRNFFAPVIGGTSNANAESHAGTLYNQEIATGHYYLNTAFNLAAFTFSYPGVSCIPDLQLEPHFTSPNPVNAGELVGFDGMESTITLNAGVKYPASGEPSPTYPIYTWDFGDGSPTVTGLAPGAPSSNSPSTSPCESPWVAPCAAAAFHSYQYGGTYQVTLTVKDVGGNTASITQQVTVDGPAPPAPPTPGGSGSGSGGGSGSGSGSGSGTGSGSGSSGSSGAIVPGVGSGASAPKIVATEAVTSRSLASVLRSGLVVRYSVSSQATGRFEVLLASSVAKKIGLKGRAATSLAAGTPPQTVIAKAILVTTQGGHSSYRIKFSKTTAARLRKLRKVSLMIRMVVHNASSPVATTVLSTANLSH
jgi:uncharacterized membrane protein YgcG